jgi:hypothetical protein
MTPREMSDIVFSKACGPFRRGDGCDHPACVEADKIAHFLKRAICVENQLIDGQSSSGWFVPDQSTRP